ncbi:MAG TPA: GNAT family N-acetyltransferase [Methylotenera sp.]|nr:GNAT family N-acetyltransferase [Methylotenera sp.]HPN02055.1 GNAT family N-acetyltransferase [Methylotenera sp.]
MRQPIVLNSIRDTDYPKLIKLWEVAGNIEIRQTDTLETLANLLDRNPTCNYAAYSGSRLIGAVLAGHDGWRGYLYHLAVKPDYRERAVGTKLVRAAVSAIKCEGIQKIHCLVKHENLIAQQFWEACGFELRDELVDYSLVMI